MGGWLELQQHWIQWAHRSSPEEAVLQAAESNSLCKTAVVSLIILVWKRYGISSYLSYINLPNNQLSFPH